MTRTPLRPLARILPARARGENLEAIERENLRLRHEAMRDRARIKAEGRLLILSVIFFAAFSVVGARMGLMAASQPSEPQHVASADDISSARADITDRHGRLLATNLVTNALYAQPPLMVDPAIAARELAEIFPDLDADRLHAQFTQPGRKFIWIRRQLSPEQVQAVHDIGEPGLLFGPREMRLYPNGRLAAHVLGGASYGRESVSAAEVIGVAGVEKTFDEVLRDPALRDRPLRLSLDLTVQSATREVLEVGMNLLDAKGASAVLMNIHSGEIAAMVSLPDFDPNNRPAAVAKADPSDSPLFNRAVQGLYELGSTLKLFPVAQALDADMIAPDTMIDTKGPMSWGRFRIRDFHYYGPKLSVTDVMVKSSNIGTARIALEIGAEAQRAFLGDLGLLEPTPLEMVEAGGAKPLLPSNWSELSTMTIAYGHGISVSPVHLAAAYASVLNGGTRVTPTLVARETALQGPRIVSKRTSARMRSMLREVVTRGTATFADVPGYAVGGKTGTADKPKPTGGYYEDKVIATFAGIFPAHAPEYVLVVMLDEPVETSGEEARRTAGWTAVPVASEVIARIAPLLGLRPEIATAGGFAVTPVKH
jgi:cell division protein FtsI (penicillin-binding protein 3)